MSAASVAGVYAEALLALAAERGERDAVIACCADLAASLSVDAIAALDDPRVGKTQATAALTQALAPRGVAPLVLDLLRLLIVRNRLGDAPAILRETVRLAEQAAGVVDVEVTTAKALSSEASARLRQRLTGLVGAGARIRERSDASLLGGITIRIGDRFIDGSVSRRLVEMRRIALEAPVPLDLWDGPAPSLALR